MLGLPAEPGAVGLSLLALGVLLGGATALLCRPVIRARLSGPPPAGLVALVLVLVVGSTTAAAPFICWRIVEDIRYTSRLTATQAEQIGADTHLLNQEVFERLKAVIPPTAAYAVVSPPTLDPRPRSQLNSWAGYTLLPRIRVDDPRRADWIIGWGVHPRDLAPRSRVVWTLRKRAGPPPRVYYVARVRP